MRVKGRMMQRGSERGPSAGNGHGGFRQGPYPGTAGAARGAALPNHFRPAGKWVPGAPADRAKSKSATASAASVPNWWRRAITLPASVG